MTEQEETEYALVAFRSSKIKLLFASNDISLTGLGNTAVTTLIDGNPEEVIEMIVSAMMADKQTASYILTAATGYIKIIKSKS